MANRISNIFDSNQSERVASIKKVDAISMGSDYRKISKLWDTVTLLKRNICVFNAETRLKMR